MRKAKSAWRRKGTLTGRKLIRSRAREYKFPVWYVKKLLSLAQDLDKLGFVQTLDTLLKLADQKRKNDPEWAAKYITKEPQESTGMEGDNGRRS